MRHLSRTRLGAAIAIAGGVLVTFAGSRYVAGASAQADARGDWEAARAAMASAEAYASKDRGVAMAHGAPVARLVIPKIGLDEIVLEGIDDDAMNGGPGHYPGSPLPGEAGNAIISAHRDRHFRRFGGLAVGDTIYTESGTRRTAWVIARRQVVDKDRPVLFPADSATLTLTTCWPIRYLGTAPDRLILTALPVG